MRLLFQIIGFNNDEATNAHRIFRNYVLQKNVTNQNSFYFNKKNI